MHPVRRRVRGTSMTASVSVAGSRIETTTTPIHLTRADSMVTPMTMPVTP